MPFPEFVRKFRPLFEINALKALKIIQHYSVNYLGSKSRSIIVCVDEVLRSADSDILIQSLHVCLGFLPDVTVFVSTLDVIPVINEPEENENQKRETDFPDYTKHNSTYDRKWITLEPLTESASLSLFSHYNLDNKPMLKWLILMANGHPRTLQKIQRSIPRSVTYVSTGRTWSGTDPSPLPPQSSRDFATATSDHDSDYKDYDSDSLSVLARDLKISGTAYSFDMIAVALKGEHLEVSTPLKHPNKEVFWPLRKFIAAGFFTNSLNPEEDDLALIPRLSLLLIYARFLYTLEAALSTKTFSQLNTTALATRKRFYNLLQMVKLMAPNTKAISAGTLGDWYQLFHSYWEGAYRVAVAGNVTTAPFLVQEFYRAPLNTDIGGGHDGLIFGKDARILLKPNKSGPIKQVVEVTSSEAFLQSLQNGEGYDKIFVLGKTNPGFDVLILERTAADQQLDDYNQQDPKVASPILILIECKSRFPESKTSKLEGNCGHQKLKNTTSQFYLKYQGTTNFFFLFPSYILLFLFLLDFDFFFKSFVQTINRKKKKKETRTVGSPKGFLA